MSNYEEIFAAKRNELAKHRETLHTIDGNIVTLKSQLSAQELSKEKLLIQLFEVERSIEFMTGLITSLNHAFDKQIEEARQHAFEEGYKTKTKEIRKSNKPVSISAGVRKRRLSKKKK
jgi:Na+/phosphate symporter